MTTLHEQPHEPIPDEVIRRLLERLSARLVEDLKDINCRPAVAAKRLVAVLGMVPEKTGESR